MDATYAVAILAQQVDSGLPFGKLALSGALGAVVALLAGYLLRQWLGRVRLDAARNQAERTIADAKGEAEVVRKKAEVEAKGEYLRGQEELRKESDALRAELKETEKRLAKREDNLEAKLDTLVTKEKNLEQTARQLDARSEELARKDEDAARLLEQRREQLLKISGISVDEARRMVLDDVRHEVEREAAVLVDKVLNTAKEEAVQRSREITLTAIQRYAGDHTSESTVSTVDIPNDEMKGRVIGREDGTSVRSRRPPAWT